MSRSERTRTTKTHTKHTSVQGQDEKRFQSGHNNRQPDGSCEGGAGGMRAGTYGDKQTRTNSTKRAHGRRPGLSHSPAPRASCRAAFHVRGSPHRVWSDRTPWPRQRNSCRPPNSWRPTPRCVGREGPRARCGATAHASQLCVRAVRQRRRRRLASQSSQHIPKSPRWAVRLIRGMRIRATGILAWGCMSSVCKMGVRAWLCVL